MAALDWKHTRDGTAAWTECKRFSVQLARTVFAGEQEWEFVALARVPFREPGTPDFGTVGWFKTRDQAKAACQVFAYEIFRDQA